MSSLPARTPASIPNLENQFATNAAIDAVVDRATLAIREFTSLKSFGQSARHDGDTTHGGRTAQWFELPDAVYVENIRDIAEIMVHMERSLVGFGFRTQHAGAEEMAPPIWPYDGVTTIDREDCNIDISVAWIDYDQMVVVYELATDAPRYDDRD